jgi:hypothetical protein
MKSILCIVDDKHIPLYRVLWVAELPHFCGDPECQCEGMYEIRLEQGESVFGTQSDRDRMIKALEDWRGGMNDDEPWE